MPTGRERSATRFLACVVLGWVALELLAAFVGPIPHPAAPAVVAEEPADLAPPG